MTLIDFSSYGLSKAAAKTAKVIAWHAASAAVVAVAAVVAKDLGDLSVAHPVYAVYLEGAVAGVNALGVFLVNWLGSVNPVSASSVAAQIANAQG